MRLLKNFVSADAFVEDDTLKGHILDRLLIFAAGCEHRTMGNIANYDPVAGRIDFNYPLGNILCVIQIED